MKVIDATWEKRNLGVECRECHITSSDLLEEVKETIDRIEGTQYLVARVPSTRMDIVQCFQKHGYDFIEAAIELENDLRKMRLPDRLRQIGRKLDWEKMNEDDLEILYEEIDKNMFKTDRIILDPFFTPQKAAQRYKYWTMDLVKEGVFPYKVRYDDKAVGFFLNKEVRPGVFDGLLAGTYLDFEGTGMGVCVQYAGLQYSKELGGRKYLGHVSANNPAVLKTLEMIGFHVKLIEYILIKHN